VPGGNKGSWPIRSKNELTPQQGHFLLAKVNVNVDFEKYFFDFARLAPTAQGQYILLLKPIPGPAEGQTANHGNRSISYRIYYFI